MDGLTPRPARSHVALAEQSWWALFTAWVKGMRR